MKFKWVELDRESWMLKDSNGLAKGFINFRSDLQMYATRLCLGGEILKNYYGYFSLNSAQEGLEQVVTRRELGHRQVNEDESLKDQVKRARSECGAVVEHLREALLDTEERLSKQADENSAQSAQIKKLTEEVASERERAKELEKKIRTSNVELATALGLLYFSSKETMYEKLHSLRYQAGMVVGLRKTLQQTNEHVTKLEKEIAEGAKRIENLEETVGIQRAIIADKDRFITTQLKKTRGLEEVIRKLRKKESEPSVTFKSGPPLKHGMEAVIYKGIICGSCEPMDGDMVRFRPFKDGEFKGGLAFGSKVHLINHIKLKAEDNK